MSTVAITERAERERVTETARQKLPGLKTAGDFLAWHGHFFSLLGAKILNKLMNNERLRIESAERNTKRRLAEKAEERRVKERGHPYSAANLARRGQPQSSAPSEWKQDKIIGPKEDRAAIEEEDRHAEEVQWSEGEGERN